MTEQELREKIIKLIKQWEDNSISIFSSSVLEAIAKQIHIFYKQANYVRLADDQTKPEPTIDIHLWRDYSPSVAYQIAQDDMQDAVFRKVEL